VRLLPIEPPVEQEALVAKKQKAKPVPTVESILKECTKEVKKGLGAKRPSADARKYWIDESRVSIAKQLANGGDWNRDKKNVLPTARKMGKVAAALATGKIVLKWAAEAAAEAVQKDPRCPGGPGSGGYCDF
jgi:hypothetical protein